MDSYRSAWLDDELDLFRDAVRRFVEMEIVPHDARWREHNSFYTEYGDWFVLGCVLLAAFGVAALRIDGSTAAPLGSPREETTPGN